MGSAPSKVALQMSGWNACMRAHGAMANKSAEIMSSPEDLPLASLANTAAASAGDGTLRIRRATA
eukprot:15465187-Alexandrium_andersonii.AAC.1